MRRREFIAGLGGAAVYPPVAWAQRADQKEPPTIGFLALGTERATLPYIEVFRSALVALGYSDQNLRVLYRFADGKAELLPGLTTELVSLGAKVIVTASTTAIRAAHAAAPTIPIVSWVSADPVLMGWAQSMARPGGRITGLFLMASSVVKPLEVLKQVRPQATELVYLFNAANPGNPHFKRMIEEATPELRARIRVVEVKEARQLAEIFAEMASLGVEGVAVLPDPLFLSHSGTIAKLALQYRIPSVYNLREFVDAGGLFAFSTNHAALIKRAAWYVDQILKGAAPGDLPAEEPIEFKLMINLKTAKALGLDIPPTLLARADEVIE